MWSEKIQSVSLGRRYTVPHRLHTNDVVATESTRIEGGAVTWRWGRYNTLAGESLKITVSPATWLSVWPVYLRIQADAYPRRAVALGVSVIRPPVNVSSSAAVAKSATCYAFRGRPTGRFAGLGSSSGSISLGFGLSLAFSAQPSLKPRAASAGEASYSSPSSALIPSRKAATGLRILSFMVLLSDERRRCQRDVRVSAVGELKKLPGRVGPQQIGRSNGSRYGDRRHRERLRGGDHHNEDRKSTRLNSSHGSISYA